ncbi:MAG: hypothetical protein V4700_06350 [Pseudomonadota bacterium]
MYKKFLVSMLLTVVLAGCHQPSDKQTGETDTASSVQDQITNPVPANGLDQTQQPVSPSSAEPTQTPPTATPDATQPVAGADTPSTTTANPDTSTTTTPTPPTSENKDSTTSNSTETK